MPDQADNDRFRSLLGLLLDDQIGEADLRELTAMVKTTPEFSDELRAQLLLDSRLAQYENENHGADAFAASVEAALDAEEDGSEFVDMVMNLADALPGRKSLPQIPWLVTAIAIAACLVFALLIVRQSPAPEPVDSGVAVVSSLVGKLTFADRELDAGDTVPPGILRLEDGYAALEFYRGAQVTIGGPAELELVDAQRVICHHGKVRANVPAVATGFTIATPDSEFVDLGTEFGVEVGDQGETEIHVFDGEVEAYDSARSPDSMTLLGAGNGMRIQESGSREPIDAESARFDDLLEIDTLRSSAEARRFEAWKAVQADAVDDPRLIAYYDFEPDPTAKRVLRNRAMSGSSLDGAIVGATWINGPWPGKRALSFKRPSDRVRVDLPGEYPSITLAAWIRVEGIDRSNSSLLLTDAYDEGEMHWQFRRDGTLILGIRHTAKSGTNYDSREFINLKRLGRWLHLTTVIDTENRMVSHYLEGRLLTEKSMKGGGPLRIGGASIGNWDVPLRETNSPIRSLNGSIAEMMVFGAALSAEEIRRLALR